MIRIKLSKDAGEVPVLAIVDIQDFFWGKHARMAQSVARRATSLVLDGSTPVEEQGRIARNFSQFPETQQEIARNCDWYSLLYLCFFRMDINTFFSLT
ncbi:hypothetical protein Y032_0096g2942 [Ancylostoma ceylanicum]|uniref:Uncharacterized protein n=1 Tax=Ancylostoma ceylanicum TaxID=53326 RepID=A0A016TKA9_9BILA|nr:hypothetical protein Y032_0096g2942 [Ancylostoma ceylanicum]